MHECLLHGNDENEIRKARIDGKGSAQRFVPGNPGSSRDSKRFRVTGYEEG